MTQDIQPLTWQKRTNLEEHQQFFSKINEIIGNLAPTVDEAEAAIAQATQAIAGANAAMATANAASAAADAAAQSAQSAAGTVAGYNTRLTAVEGKTGPHVLYAEYSGNLPSGKYRQFAKIPATNPDTMIVLDVMTSANGSNYGFGRMIIGNPTTTDWYCKWVYREAYGWMDDAADIQIAKETATGDLMIFAKNPTITGLIVNLVYSKYGSDIQDKPRVEKVTNTADYSLDGTDVGIENIVPGSDYADYVKINKINEYAVGLTGNQTIAGKKIFLGDMQLSAPLNRQIQMKATEIHTVTAVPSSQSDLSVRFLANDDTEIANIIVRSTADGWRGIRIILNGTGGQQAALNLVAISPDGTVTYPWTN